MLKLPFNINIPRTGLAAVARKVGGSKQLRGAEVARSKLTAPRLLLCLQLRTTAKSQKLRPDHS